MRRCRRCRRCRRTLAGAALVAGPLVPAAQPGPPIARIAITSASSGAPVRIITPPDPWMAVLGGTPTRRRGDTLFVRAPARLQASLARHDVRIEAADRADYWRDLVVEVDVAGAGRRRFRAAGPAIVLKAGGRAVEAPGSAPPVVEERGADRPAPRARFAPAPALSRAFPGSVGAWIALSRPDTMISLAVPCPARGDRGAARRVVVPDTGGVQVGLTIGPGAHQNGLGYAVGFPRHPATRDEAAIAGAVRVAGGCAVGDTLTLTVDSLVFPSRRLAVRSPVLLPISLPAP
jgi:hypothetical protein